MKYLHTTCNTIGTRNTFFCEYDTGTVYGLEVDIVNENETIVDEDGESMGLTGEGYQFHANNIRKCLSEL